MTIKLKKPVGKSSGGAIKATNKPDDVLLVRQMLRANKLMVAANGKMDAGVEKAILAAQRKAGLKSPDGVVEPKGPTFQYLLPKYARLIKQAGNQKWYKVKFAGKPHFLNATGRIEVQNALFASITPGVSKIISRHAMAMEYYQEYLDVAAFRDGAFEAVMQLSAVTLSRASLPSDKTVKNAMNAVKSLRVSVKRRDLDGTRKAFEQAGPAVNKFYREMLEFQKDLIGGAGRSVTALEFTSDASFAIFEALATAVMTPNIGADADIIAASSKAFLKSTAQQYGKYLAGQDVDVGLAAAEVIADVVFELLVTKLGGDLAKKIDAKALIGASGPKLVAALSRSKLPIKLSSAQAETVIKNWLAGAGASAMKAVVSETSSSIYKLIKSGMKKGKAPNADEILDVLSGAFSNIVASALLGGLAQHQKRFAHHTRRMMLATYGPKEARRVLKREIKSGLTKKIQEKAILDAYNKVEKKVLTAGGIVLVSTFLDNPKRDPTGVALSALEKDNAAFAKEFEAELVKAVKRLNTR